MPPSAVQPPTLVLGPLLRHVDPVSATVWVEVDRACEVEVLGRRSSTFCVRGHHYALVVVEDLEPGSTTPYDVRLDGVPVWPQPGSEFAAGRIRTPGREGAFTIAFGSCRYATDATADAADGIPPDALQAYAVRGNPSRTGRTRWCSSATRSTPTSSRRSPGDGCPADGAARSSRTPR